MTRTNLTGTVSTLGAITLAGAIAMALFTTGCSSEASETAGAVAPAQVSVAEVLVRDVHPWDEYTGRIAAVDSVELRLGLRERARSDAALARAQNARAQALIEAQAISREDFESRKAASASGVAGVRAAEAAVAAARLNLQFTEIRAPIDGRAGRALITEGNLAQADATLLTTLVSVDPVHVYFEADEQSFLRYRQEAGDNGTQADPVRVGLAGEEGYPHAGTVDFVDNQIDTGTGTVRVRAVLPNPDGQLAPGLFARVQLQGGAGFRAALVDDKAILTDQDRKYVYVVDDKHTAQRRDIEVAGIADGLRIVTGGLQAGDQVVVDGVQKVFFPGMPVQDTVVPMDGTDAPATADTPPTSDAPAPADVVAAR